MYFMIKATDIDNSAELRAAHVDEHRSRLRALVNEGRLLVAGPLPEIASGEAGNVTGSLIIAEFDSLDEATAWANADVYKRRGVYQEIELKPFIPVLP